MSDYQRFDVGLNDVYDFAYVIAQEFEKIVLFCDIDVLKPVIDKVINVLEILEASVKKIEHLEAEVRVLKSNNLNLHSEKLLSDQQKCKLKQIYEDSEESWVEEVVNLKSQLSILKSENELLRGHLAEKKEAHFRTDDKSREAIEEQTEIINRLNHVIKQNEKQLQENISVINTLNSKIQELLKMNKILHLKNEEARVDMGKLLAEKNDSKYELPLHEGETDEEELQRSASCLQKDGDKRLRGALTGDLSCHSHPESLLEKKIKSLQLELQSLRAKSQQHETNVTNVNSDKNERSLSKIHQLFHLFLGVATFPEFCFF